VEVIRFIKTILYIFHLYMQLVRLCLSSWVSEVLQECVWDGIMSNKVWWCNSSNYSYKHGV